MLTGYTSKDDFISILRIVWYYLNYPLPFFDINLSIFSTLIASICLFNVFSTIRKLLDGGD